MEEIKIYYCGTKVIPKMQKMEAMITCSTIRFDRVVYEVSYFYNGEYKTIWLHENEFDVEKDIEKGSVGFK